MLFLDRLLSHNIHGKQSIESSRNYLIMAISSLATEAVRCNLCGANEPEVIYAEVPHIYTAGTQVVRCRQCGLVYLTPRLKHLADNFAMDETYLYKFYLPYYQQMGLLTNEGMVAPEANRAFHASYLDRMRPYCQTNRVLDVGCGIGLFMVAARQDGWDAYGVEPAGPLSIYGQSRFGLSIIQGELAMAGFPHRHFDVVTLWAVTEHLLDPLTVLRTVYQLLRPGGLLLLNVPNWDSMARHTLEVDWEMFVTDHFYYFTRTTMGTLIQRAGFRILQLEADLLCEPEFAEIASKVDHATAEAARHITESASDRGSSIEVTAERPVIMRDRVRKASHLLRKGEWRKLGLEARRYLRWVCHLG
jgi:SAM-dependent methyltransferase